MQVCPGPRIKEKCMRWIRYSDKSNKVKQSFFFWKAQAKFHNVPVPHVHYMQCTSADGDGGCPNHGRARLRYAVCHHPCGGDRQRTAPPTNFMPSFHLCKFALSEWRKKINRLYCNTTCRLHLHDITCLLWLNNSAGKKRKNIFTSI